MFRTETDRKLNAYQSTTGNWRFKGLLLAAFEDAETVGDRWPTTDRYLAAEHKHSPYRAMHNPDEGVRNVVVPADREGHELSHAREEFSKGEMKEEIPRDHYFKRMLLRGSVEELDTLWREELLTTVIEGAQVKEVARDAAQVVPVDAKKGDWPRGEGAGYADENSEGGRIESEQEDYDTVAYKCTKYTAGFSVTDEMVRETQIPAIERQVRFAGKKIENSLNRRWINQLLDGTTTNDIDTDQATPTYSEVQAVNHMVGAVEGSDYPEPQYLVVHPEYKTAYFDEANISQANYAGSDSALRQRVFDPIFGMEMLTASSGVYNSSTNTWDWDANDEYGAIVTNPDFMAIFMWQDIATKDFEDPIRDVQGGNARAWFDAQVLRDAAHARAKY